MLRENDRYRQLRSNMHQIARQTWQLMKPSFSEGKSYFQITLNNLHGDCCFTVHNQTRLVFTKMHCTLEYEHCNASDPDLVQRYRSCFIRGSALNVQHSFYPT